MRKDHIRTLNSSLKVPDTLSKMGENIFGTINREQMDTIWTVGGESFPVTVNNGDRFKGTQVFPLVKIA